MKYQVVSANEWIYPDSSNRLSFNRLMNNIRVAIDSQLADNISVRSVGLVPSELPNYEDHDDYLLRTTPGLYPDPLFPMDGQTCRTLPNQWWALWITVHFTGNAAPGQYPIHIKFIADTGELLGSESFQLDVIAAVLPEQELIHTEWFYLDCLAAWYKVKAFSEPHWDIIESYVSHYVEYGLTMILTPLFTTPLEMDVGKERPTVQMIEVKRDGNQYMFDFSRLERWIELCQRNGIKYFEFSHLFTQWGGETRSENYWRSEREGGENFWLGHGCCRGRVPRLSHPVHSQVGSIYP